MGKEIKITPPDGYEIDKENSTFACIKFKPIAKRWRDNQNSKINGYWIKSFSEIDETLSCRNTPDNYNVFATVKQAKSALAMARISQIMANDTRFGGVVTDEEWMDGDCPKFALERLPTGINKYSYFGTYQFLAFHTAEQRDLFLRENEDLVKDYLML